MAPPELVPFFSASMGAAAALLGLLFVAVSISPEGTVGPAAPLERQAVADGVFTAMIDAFFVSMGGAIPNASLGSVALTLGAIALSHTVFTAWRLWPRPFSLRDLSRRLFLVLLGLVIYSGQLASGLQLVSSPASLQAATGQINVLFAVYAFAIVRSWQLLGARRGMLNTIIGGVLEGGVGRGSTPPDQAMTTADAPASGPADAASKNDA